MGEWRGGGMDLRGWGVATVSEIVRGFFQQRNLMLVFAGLQG